MVLAATVCPAAIAAVSFAPKVCDPLPAETDTSPADASQPSVEATEAAQNCPSAAHVAATVQHQSEWGESTSCQKLHSSVLPVKYIGLEPDTGTAAHAVARETTVT